MAAGEQVGCCNSHCNRRQENVEVDSRNHPLRSYSTSKAFYTGISADRKWLQRPVEKLKPASSVYVKRNHYLT